MSETKAEIAAKLWAKSLYETFVNPGKDAGPNFDVNAFDVEGFLEAMVSMSYGVSKVPEKSMKKGLVAGRAEWDRLMKEGKAK